MSTGQRRLMTPSRELRSDTRSRSRLRSRSPEPDIELRRERLRMLEDEVRWERDRVRAAENLHRSSRRSDEPRASSRRCSATMESTLRRDIDPRAEQREDLHRASQRSDEPRARSRRRSVSTASARRRDVEVRGEQRDRACDAEDLHRASRRSDDLRASSRLRSAPTASTRCRDAVPGAERRVEHGPRQHDRAERTKRSRSHSFSKSDIFNIIRDLRDGFASSPVNQGAPQPIQKISHENILPKFDPSSKTQRMDTWLKKVNECALVYGWDERTTTHFAMQKLQGLAKTWYESLHTILFTWQEWQEKLLSAFPCEQNYGQTLETMIRRKSSHDESIEVYYYEKLSLVNQCDIVGTRAVECIIHGITDKTLKSGALALRCTHPDQLLQYLLSNREYNSQSGSDRFHNRRSDFDDRVPRTASSTGGQSSLLIRCFNCREKGHSFLHCPKPLTKCTRCDKIGHTAEKCHIISKTNASGVVQKAAD
ncbi:hypothetical protein PYW08_010839 [Mythimna loreyi]|uniref:Uncharacterized protein n=1 Tax=Mythimna loreyi TaxID=667449 RepID=A0ACC2Q587_9NEOP|nr:hypothetical protein PYW08_010839 [Mythimna loreyi]